MNYSFATNLYDKDGDIYEDCILVFASENTILKFKNVSDLEQFANSILHSIPEIKENLLTV
jgi:hypothetical protein